MEMTQLFKGSIDLNWSNSIVHQQYQPLNSLWILLTYLYSTINLWVMSTCGNYQMLNPRKIIEPNLILVICGFKPTCLWLKKKEAKSKPLITLQTMGKAVFFDDVFSCIESIETKKTSILRCWSADSGWRRQQKKAFQHGIAMGNI